MTKMSEKILIKGDYITLGQFLKVVNAVESGAMAKIVIADGEVFVNGEVEVRRGKKLRQGDHVSFDGVEYEVVNED